MLAKKLTAVAFMLGSGFAAVAEDQVYGPFFGLGRALGVGRGPGIHAFSGCPGGACGLGNCPMPHTAPAGLAYSPAPQAIYAAPYGYLAPQQTWAAPAGPLYWTAPPTNHLQPRGVRLPAAPGLKKAPAAAPPKDPEPIPMASPSPSDLPAQNGPATPWNPVPTDAESPAPPELPEPPAAQAPSPAEDRVGSGEIRPWKRGAARVTALPGRRPSSSAMLAPMAAPGKQVPTPARTW